MGQVKEPHCLFCGTPAYLRFTIFSCPAVEALDFQLHSPSLLNHLYCFSLYPCEVGPQYLVPLHQGRNCTLQRIHPKLTPQPQHGAYNKRGAAGLHLFDKPQPLLRIGERRRDRAIPRQDSLVFSAQTLGPP
jgi:hypothetical protein